MSAPIPGGSPFDQLDTLRDVAPGLEAAAAEYWAEVDPYQNALRSVLDTIGNSERWPAAVRAATDAVRAAGLAGLVAEITAAEKWKRRPSDRDYWEVMGGYALAELLAGLLSGSDEAAFRRYEGYVARHPEFVSQRTAQTRELLEFLLNNGVHRIVLRYVETWNSVLTRIGGWGYQLIADLEATGCPLSEAAGVAVRHWEECRTYGYSGWPVYLRLGPDPASFEPAGDEGDGDSALAATQPEAAADQVAGERPPVRLKKSTTRGEARLKLIAALTQHHRYADGGCLNLEPIGNNGLARLAGVSPSTASDFFEANFKGFERYKAQCRNSGQLIFALKLLNNEFAPHLLFDSQPPTAPTEDDEDE